MSVVFDAEDYWNPGFFEQERQLWWSFAHANSQRIEEILSAWDRPVAHFCDSRLRNSLLHLAAGHVELFDSTLLSNLVERLVGLGIEVDALNENGQTALHIVGIRFSSFIHSASYARAPNLGFIGQLLRNGSQCALNAQGEHPLVEILSLCPDASSVDDVLDFFSSNGANLTTFFCDPMQLNHPRIALWCDYLTRRAASEQQQRILHEVEARGGAVSKRKM